MKKMLKTSLLLALALPVMVGCNKGPSYKETRTEEEIITELAQQALAEVGVSYSAFSSTGLAYGYNDLITTVNQKVWDGDEIGLNFKLTYQVTPQEDYDEPLVSVTEEGDKLFADLVTKDKLGDIGLALDGAAYTLTGSISFEGYGENFKVNGLTTTDEFVGKKIASKNWNAVAKCAKTGTSLADLKANSQNDEYVYFVGEFHAWYEHSFDQLYSGAFITDGDDGIMIYAGSITKDFFNADTEEPTIEPGDIVSVFGKVSPYNGLYEVKPVKVAKVTNQTIIDSIEPATEKVMTVPEINAAGQEQTGRMVTVSGLTLKELPASLDVGSHWTVKAQDADGVELTIYINYHIGAEAQNAIKTVLEGLGTNTFTFHGVLSCYNAMQVSPVNTSTGSASGAFVAE